MKKQGLHAWLHDECFYPSGWDCGLAIPLPLENHFKNIVYRYALFRQGELSPPEGAIQYIWAAFYPASGIKPDYQQMLRCAFIPGKSTQRLRALGIACLHFRSSHPMFSTQIKRSRRICPADPASIWIFWGEDAVRYCTCGGCESGDTFDVIFTDEPALRTAFCSGTQSCSLL